MSKRRRKGAAGKVTASAVVVLAAAGAAAAAFGFDFSWAADTSDNATDAATPAATAEIVEQTLTEIVTVAGDLDYGEALNLGCLLNGTYTALPAVGDVIERGDELYAVDDKPVTLLYGSLPAYRPFAPGAEGTDVEQFEENLSALGYDGFTVDDEYTEVTATAVKEWQEDLGLKETGTVDLGRIVFAPGEIRVDTVEAALGEGAGPGGPVYTYTELDKVVTVEVEMKYRDLVAVGDTVAITLPDGTESEGTVTDIATVVAEAADGSNDEDETVLQVTVAATDPSVFDGLDQASVDTGFAGAVAEEVLTVPVAALLGLTEGGYGLEVVDGDSTELIAVDTGLFADGFVEVSGEGISAGMTVGMPS